MTNASQELKTANTNLENAINITNKKIEEMSPYSQKIYETLNEIHKLFDQIRNTPTENKKQYEKLKKLRNNWKNKAELIEKEFQANALKVAGQGAAGAGVGVAVVALGPSAAMGLATTFGVASTGTAISALSGAAATNAALAWLGGGALAAGGGGMAAGSSFLALAGPLGWTIAGVALITSGIIYYNLTVDKERLEKIFTLICKRDTKSYEQAAIDLDKRIKDIKEANDNLTKAIADIKTFGTDYNNMTEKQQYRLGSYVNLVESATWYLTEPILGLLPKFTEEDFKKLCKVKDSCRPHKFLIMCLANLLYKIELDINDKKVLYSSLKNNDAFLSSIKMTKDSFKLNHINMVEQALNYRYQIRY